MTLSQVIRDYLLADLAIAAIVADRLYPERAPEDLQETYAVYLIDLKPSVILESEPTPMIDADLGIVAMSQSYDQAFELADLFRQALECIKGLLGGTSGLHIESSTWIETVGNSFPGETAELGLFGTLSRFTIQYLPQ